MESPLRKLWREEILSGVETVPKYGTPGKMVVFGDTAEPILTGNTAGDVLVAAAELGNGRMVVFTHDTYTKKWFLENKIPENAQKLCNNILSWVTKGKYTKEWQVVKLTKDSLQAASPDNTILVWQSPKPADAELLEDLTKFTKEEGIILIGVTPWGAMDIFGINVDEISCYKFLREVQIFLNDGYNPISGAEINVANNKAEFAHVGVELQKLKNGETKIGEMSTQIIAALFSIPDEDFRALLKDYICGIDIMNIIRSPHPENPLKTNEERAAALFLNLVVNKLQMKAPGIQDFPGDFDEPPPTSSIEYKIESYCDEAHPVGAYLAPGGTAVVEIMEGNPDGWKVQVGCHSDNLKNKDTFERWPDIVAQKKLNAKAETEIHSPFGGSIYFLSPKGTSSLSTRITDVVASPMFHLYDKPEHWNENRGKPGLWTNLVGKHIMLSVPSKTVREMDHPLEVVQFWDEVVIAHHDLRGVDLANKRRQWIVPDVQPSAGNMHSGYPVVTHMDAADPQEKMFLLRKPKKAADVVDGHWGYFHELGHNMQDGAWTFQGTGEVTCNIFALHAMEKLFSIPAWQHPWLEGYKEAMKNYLKNGAKFDEWKNYPGVALGIYAQLARDFGFDTYKKVFRQYESERPNLASDQEEIDHWVKSFSKAADSNLVPAFKLWGIPVSKEIVKELEGMKVYLPKDEVTEVVMSAS